MRVLFDTNVVLDVLLARQPHAIPAAGLFDYVARRELDGLLCATTVTTVFYLAAKTVGPTKARQHVHTLMGMFDVAPVTRAVLADALGAGFKDYEDGVLHEAARHAGATAIVTRNGKDFGTARLTLYEPAEFLSLVQAAQ